MAELAGRTGTSPDAVQRWLSGDDYPSRGQFTKIVEALKRPSAVFLLPEPPEQYAVPARFRSPPGSRNRDLTAKELREIRWARRIQRITSTLLADSSGPTVDLARHSLNDPPQEVAERTRRELGISVQEQLDWKSDGEAFRCWREAFEQQGLLTLQLELGVEGLRGFSSFDDYAPLIACNTAYTYGARIFTLGHEYAHLLLRDDASCAVFPDPDSTDQEMRAERWCEEFAAGLLLPPDAFMEQLFRFDDGSRTELRLVASLARKFNCSLRAVAVRIERLGERPRGFYDLVNEQAVQKDKEKGGGPGGGPPPRLDQRLGQLGPRSCGLLAEALEEGSLSERDARGLFRLDGTEVQELADRHLEDR